MHDDCDNRGGACQQCRQQAGGYYLQKWVGDRFASVAWFYSKEDAERELRSAIDDRKWWGLPPRVVAAEN